ncbi:MAG: hypothetical protein PVI86_09565 [Phycisphaerae bacterium]|jgi:hypothetical protein
MGKDKHKTRQWMVRVLRAVVVAVPVMLVGGWLAFHHKPVWYRPPRLDERGVKHARSDAVNTADSISERMVAGAPFTVVLAEQTVNEWLTALPHAWPEARDALPTEIREPAIGFRGGRLWIGAHCKTGDWQAIVSLGLKVEPSADGAELHLALDSVRGGSLPLPKAVVAEAWKRLHRQLCGDSKTRNGTTGPLFDALRDLDSIDDLHRGVDVANRFVWFNGERPYRIRSVSIDDGRIKLEIEPL